MQKTMTINVANMDEDKKNNLFKDLKQIGVIEADYDEQYKVINVSYDSERMSHTRRILEIIERNDITIL